MPISAIHPITHNLFRQFWNVTFNKIFCKLVLKLFNGTPKGHQLSLLLLVTGSGYFCSQVSGSQKLRS